MGMSGHYRHVSSSVYAKVLAEPALARHVRVFQASSDGLPPELRAMFRGLPEVAALELKRQLFLQGLDKVFAKENQAAKAALEAAGVRPDELGEALNLDKAWHGVHVVLAGTKWEPTAPPGDAVLGGRPVGPAEGYGPMRFLSPEEVAVTAGALSAITDDEFRRRCDPALLVRHEVYATAPDDPREIDWLVDAFVRLRAYYVGAAALSHAMALYVA